MALVQPSDKLKALLRATASNDQNTAIQATRELGVALRLPLRQGILSGPIGTDIFEQVSVGSENSTYEYPIDLLRPGTEGDYVAYTIPNHGRVESRTVEGDYIRIPIYDIGNGIEWNLKFSRDADWNVVGRATEIMKWGFQKKITDDGWHVLLAAAADRNIIIYDADASAGQFTKRLVSLSQNVMRRNGGGNSTSTNRGALTDLFVSPEAISDIRSWGVDQCDDVTRNKIFNGGENVLRDIFGVTMTALDEFGVGQEYELFLENDLGVLPVSTGSDVELGLGLDLRNRDSFLMPVKQEVEIFPRTDLHVERKAGLYGWAEQGFAVLDNRRVILVSM